MLIAPTEAQHPALRALGRVSSTPERCGVDFLFATRATGTVGIQRKAFPADFLASVGLEEPGLNQVIRTGYEMLDLITFFTAGEVEVRAWTIKRGTKAPQAAGKIHTDFERGFIKAEVIYWKDRVELGTEAAVRAAGKLGIEGKDYVVRDGDVMHFRFNV